MFTKGPKVILWFDANVNLFNGLQQINIHSTFVSIPNIHTKSIDLSKWVNKK